MTPSAFSDVLASPGVTEQLELRGSFGFMAYHGGGLEVTTDVIASLAAEQSGASYYGVTHPDDDPVHVPSIEVGPPASPALATFLDHVDVVVTIHGFGRRGMFTTILLGGQNRELAAHIGRHLRPALPEYEVIDDLDAIPIELRGVHPANPVNLPNRRGVQIELPPRVRGSSPIWADWTDGLVPHTTSLIGALAAAARTAPER
jgi:phage replication-related protein YjqB (UPF0714/DUF867 family)